VIEGDGLAGGGDLSGDCAEGRSATAVDTADRIASGDFDAMPLQAGPLLPHDASAGVRTTNKTAGQKRCVTA
jgi:hypothetical protein